MNIQTFLGGLLLASALLQTTGAQAQTVPPPSRALILYDAPQGLYQKYGFATSILLRNLLGHFNTSSISMMPVEKYTAGAINNYDVIFYVGTTYDNPIPKGFLSDIDANLKLTTPKSVVWFKYNLWQIAWDTANYSFTGSTGITFTGLKGFNSPPSNTNQKPGFYDTVSYKGQSMVKYYYYNSATGTVNADPDVGATAVATPAQSLVSISNSGNTTAPVLPYVVKSKNFWYFADNPFSFIGPRDRYLVFADLLHDIMGQDHPTQHLALVRLEDVNAGSTTASMKSLTNYMAGIPKPAAGVPTPIPFAIATIPHYRDPYGEYNGGIAENIPMSQATNLKNALIYARDHGGSIVQHGWTHQSDDPVFKNSINGVSGEDYEFWNNANNTPMPNENGSTAWSTNRMDQGLKELNNAGFTPFAWEAPHYQSSSFSIKSNVAMYKKVYGRVVYYTADIPDLKGTSGVYDYAVGQVFPYVIYNDYYGQYVIPENLGNIEHKVICSYCTDYLPSDLILNAKYALTVRDGYASFFFHPYLLEPESTNLGVNGMQDFRDIITGITKLGYKWAAPNLQ